MQGTTHTSVSIDPWGMVIAISLWSMWASLLIYSLFFFNFDQNSLFVSALLFVSLSVLYTGVFITAHDGMHGSISARFPQANKMIGQLCLSSYALFSFSKMLKEHRKHHQNPGIVGKDPDFHSGSPSYFQWYFNFFKNYFSWRQLFLLVMMGAFLEYGLGVKKVNLFLFWVGSSVTSSMMLFYFGTYLPHREEQKSPFPDHHRARSLYGSKLFSLFSCFHFGGFHHEHHLEPQVPWWKLPERKRV